jgi:hypothetical protein
MSKNLVLMRDVICKYHPSFVKSSGLRKYGLENPQIFNVERLVEESLAAVGGYDYVDEEGYDFSDFSDSKTTSINFKTRRAHVGSVETKIGALRITSYNPHLDSLAYFFVSQTDVKYVKLACYGISSHKERILFSWQPDGDHYNSFEEYRKYDFESLARSS